MKADWQRIMEGVKAWDSKHPSRIVMADGATILEPGVLKICSEYKVNVINVSFVPNREAIRICLGKGDRRNEFTIARELIENDQFSIIESTIRSHAKLLSSPDYEEIREEKEIRKAVEDAIKELRC